MLVLVMKMEFNLLRLKNNLEKNILIDMTYSFDEELLKQADLLDLKDVTIQGDIHKDCLDEIILEVDVKGVMELPCAITLKPVEHPFSFKISGNIEELLEEIDENAKKSKNTIDILPIIWENILMEIPMKVVSDDADLSALKGDGWRVITEDMSPEINSGLEKLKDLL